MPFAQKQKWMEFTALHNIRSAAKYQPIQNPKHQLIYIYYNTLQTKFRTST